MAENAELNNPHSSNDNREDTGSNSLMSPSQQPMQTPRADALSRKHFLLALSTSIGLGLLLASLLLYFAPILSDLGYGLLRPLHLKNAPMTTDMRTLKREIKKLAKKNFWLKNRLNNYQPLTPYLIVDTSENIFILKRGNKIIRQGICSTGSYTLLKTKDDNQQWIFKTPRGMFRIQAKVVSPTWRMPDWAFIEEGKPVPPENSPDRFERGVLGDYAMALGDGYLIHGTLYQRFLGLAVTHGCVRLGDDDLKIVFNHLELGSKVFIY